MNGTNDLLGKECLILYGPGEGTIVTVQYIAQFPGIKWDADVKTRQEGYFCSSTKSLLPTRELSAEMLYLLQEI